MAEIRGEKVKFTKRDIVPLHGLPSAKVEDPLIVHCPPPRSMMRGILKVFTALCVLAFLSIGGIILSVETGAVDGVLSNQAQQALEKAIGQRYDSRIGSSVIRFASGFRLALEARDVDIVDEATGQHLSRVGSIRMALDPLALLTGRVSVESLEAVGMELDTALLPKGPAFDPTTLRVDAVPVLLEQAFIGLERLSQAFHRSGTAEIGISDLAIRLPPKPDGTSMTITLRDLAITPGREDGYTLAGEVLFNDEIAALSLVASGEGEALNGFEANLDGFDIGPFFEKYDPDGNLHQAINVKAGINVSAKRAQGDNAPTLSATVGLGDGTLHLGGDSVPVSGGLLNARYDFSSNMVNLVDQSKLVFGPTIVPVLADIKDTPEGFGIALRVNNGTASAEASGEIPVSFNLTSDGVYDKANKLLDFPSLYVSTPLGDMAGSLKVRFAEEGAPEISFGGQIPKMDASAVKQLWPFWMARKARPWVVSNIFGGTVTNGSIAVFIPQGRMCGPGCPLVLDDSELQIRFDITDTRLNIAGDIPPLRDADAHFEMVGERIEVDISKAGSYFPSNRVLVLDNSKFVVASVYEKPLMAHLDLNAAGSGDTIAELATFRPINALKDTEFKPSDFTGNVRAHVVADLGLLNSQSPPPPVWAAKLDLDGVSLTRPIAGRTVADLKGTLDIDNQTLKLNGKGRVDDVPMDISMTEPTRKGGSVNRERILKASLTEAQMEKFAPGLSNIIGGTAAVEISGTDDASQNVKVDLSQASLTVPGIGWNKGAGINADATFVMKTADGRTTIGNFELDGDGFGATGEMVFGKGGLVSADFSHLQLAPIDDYAVQVARNKNGYTINASGKSADLRPIISRLRSAGGSSSDSNDLSGLFINAKFDRITGFNDEVLSNVSSEISIQDGKVRSVDFKGVTGNGQAVVAQTSSNGQRQTVSLTSSDAGSFVRFANLYSRIRGGLLNVGLSSSNGQDWSGNIDIRNFAVMNEAKLQDIVATPAGEDGRSLNKAVRRNIDVSSEKFQRGFARVVYGNGLLSVENGVVRGEQIGATFQGLVRDQNGNMDMTGTFMPAYGLNRLFAELPFIGIFLGNGRDRGLLGITFKLTGKTESPRLNINPLSLIAPGVFRQIFEFQ